jgi:hypothetical protein
VHAYLRTRILTLINSKRPSLTKKSKYGHAPMHTPFGKQPSKPLEQTTPSANTSFYLYLYKLKVFTFVL